MRRLQDLASHLAGKADESAVGEMRGYIESIVTSLERVVESTNKKLSELPHGDMSARAHMSQHLEEGMSQFQQHAMQVLQHLRCCV